MVIDICIFISYNFHTLCNTGGGGVCGGSFIQMKGLRTEAVEHFTMEKCSTACPSETLRFVFSGDI